VAGTYAKTMKEPFSPYFFHAIMLLDLHLYTIFIIFLQ